MYYNMSGDGFYNLSNYTWLRSGSNAESYIAWYMSAAGYKYSLRACTKQAVRPALYMIGFFLAEKLRVAVMRGFINIPLIRPDLTVSLPSPPRGKAKYNNRVLLYPKSTLTFGRIN